MHQRVYNFKQKQRENPTTNKRSEKMKLFSIKDIKAEGFNPPFHQTTFGLAERAFKQAASDPQSQIATHKEDFSLYHVADFDHKTGEIIPIVPPTLVCKAE